ncbi:hypothetical protein MJO28_006997 [Puccinia striiformis f. sp. tritici]|uniref:Uncharacterized protein n=1 Tax=Puccinia striiformis f. sp. tritici TaxID=168172 RepID=A0ACC0EEE9_9BASI|nr:hypothetical protein MJO28_006997 [Puccinia striiformis f. sp. tritici]KAI7955555.1 hypothetical protein MJO29_006954 [Puccinia striiformis f. sp. tritici]
MIFCALGTCYHLSGCTPLYASNFEAQESEQDATRNGRPVSRTGQDISKLYSDVASRRQANDVEDRIEEQTREATPYLGATICVRIGGCKDRKIATESPPSQHGRAQVITPFEWSPCAYDLIQCPFRHQIDGT